MSDTHLSIPEVLSCKGLVYKVFECLAIELRQALSVEMKMRKKIRIVEEVSRPLPKITIVDIIVPRSISEGYRNNVFCKLR